MTLSFMNSERGGGGGGGRKPETHAEETRVLLETMVSDIQARCAQNEAEAFKELPRYTLLMELGRCVKYLTPPEVETAISCMAQLESQVVTDALTGVANRRGLDLTLHRLTSALKREKEQHPPFVFAIVDIDFFKKVNNVQGHDVGDQLLTQVAAIISDTLRPSDRVYRIGGEEFAIVLSNTNSQQAGIALERVRQAIAEQTQQTVSIGYSQYQPSQKVTDEDNHNLEILLNEADLAMYGAKNSGRNRLADYALLTAEQKMLVKPTPVEIAKKDLTHHKPWPNLVLPDQTGAEIYQKYQQIEQPFGAISTLQVLFCKALSQVPADQFVNEQAEQLPQISAALALFEKLSDTDELTQLLNRRALDRDLAAHLSEITRQNPEQTKKALLVIICDLDNLTKLNTDCGHLGADAVLRAVANILKKSLRTGTDKPYRFGGDEMAILAELSPSANGFAENSMVFLERCRQAILTEAQTEAQKVLLSLGLTELKEKIAQATITMTFGATIVEQSSLNSEKRLEPDTVFQQADTALREAKLEGKNRFKLV